jgi:DMSO/TMAO reductase YedYZ molybdopterin-dependent catalytic subunit
MTKSQKTNPGLEALAGRLPPGQHLVNHLPVLDLGNRPVLNLTEWTLTLAGTIDSPQVLDWATLQTLPQCEVVADIHCVTRWTRLAVPWVGVLAAAVIQLAKPQPLAKYVVIHSADEYTTNLPRAALLDEDVLLAYAVDGEPLPVEHGGPVRLVVPKRYFWKSAKWITAIHFHETDQPGFWETRGYHNEADPFQEERFS